MGYDADVLIVGGGPAGLAAAIAARAKGLAVMVADGANPPISKPCGEGLLPDSVSALRKLGVALGPTDGHVLRGICFADRAVSVRGEFRGTPGLGVRREVLHRRMVERAEECGVSLLWNSPVTGLTDSGAVVAGNKVCARWVIGADGIRSRVRRWAGLEDVQQCGSRFAWRQHYRAKAWSDSIEVHWNEHAQAYVTPVGAEEICVALIANRPNVRVSQTLHKFPALARRLAAAQRANTERGAITSMCALRRVSHGRVALVGDASGTVDAITGQGLSLGFQQALVLADALKRGHLEHYQREHRQLARRPRFMANLLLFLGRRHAVRKRTFRALQAAPNLFECMVAYHVGETRPFELAATGAQFSWRFLTA